MIQGISAVPFQINPTLDLTEQWQRRYNSLPGIDMHLSEVNCYLILCMATHCTNVVNLTFDYQVNSQPWK